MGLVQVHSVYLLILGPRPKWQECALLTAKDRNGKAKPGQANRVEISAYVSLAKASHKTKSITRGVVSFLPPWKGREDSEYLLNNNTLQRQEIMEFPSQVVFTNRRDLLSVWVPLGTILSEVQQRRTRRHDFLKMPILVQGQCNSCLLSGCHWSPVSFSTRAVPWGWFVAQVLISESLCDCIQVTVAEQT